MIENNSNYLINFWKHLATVDRNCSDVVENPLFKA